MPVADRLAWTTLRMLGALCVLGIGAVHVYENVAQHYDALPVIGVLFWLNAASALVIGVALLLPPVPARGLGRWAGPAQAAPALAGILLAAGSIAGLLVSEATTLFGFHEHGWRDVVAVAVLVEGSAILLLGTYLATGARPVRRRA